MLTFPSQSLGVIRNFSYNICNELYSTARTLSPNMSSLCYNNCVFFLFLSFSPLHLVHLYPACFAHFAHTPPLPSTTSNVLVSMQSPPKGATIPYRPKPQVNGPVIVANGQAYTIQGNFAVPTQEVCVPTIICTLCILCPEKANRIKQQQQPQPPINITCLCCS